MIAAAEMAFDGLSCQGCGAHLNVAKGERTAKCPYCASPSVVMRPRSDVEDPTFVLGFVIPEKDARERARRWIRSTWFTPSAFAKSDVTQVRGVYLPAYVYTAAAHVDYSAEIGENYTVTETYTTTDSKGRTVTRTRTRTETEWRSLSGKWAAYLDDEVVTASKGLHNAELEAVEPFDLRALRRYTPKLLSGWIAEDPSRGRAECLKMAHDEAVGQIGGRLSNHMPGDSHRGLEYTTNVVHEHLELVLLPVWILAVRYDDEAPLIRMVLNGQTGRITGRPPRSWIKITITVLSVITALVVAYLIASAR